MLGFILNVKSKNHILKSLGVNRFLNWKYLFIDRTKGLIGKFKKILKIIGFQSFSYWFSWLIN